jgi:MerR family transcriptional regulator, light-induced transcriptional regulator
MTSSLNIAALTRRTGVPPDTIRKWEQRYGVLRPNRTAGGQRRYSEQDVARVLWLQARIAEGYRIGEAAALLGPTPGAPSNAEELREAFVEAARRGDPTVLAATVEQALLLPLERAFEEVLAPALVEVGAQWRAGRLSVADEHLASSAVRAGLQQLLADARGNVRGTAVLACATGERHEIGLMMLGILLRADGWQVAYLGPDVPFADATGLALRLEASVLCFSASSTEAAKAVQLELAGAKLPAELTVLVGGRATSTGAARRAVSSLRRTAG